MELYKACSMVNGIGCIALSVQGSKFVVEIPSRELTYPPKMSF